LKSSQPKTTAPTKPAKAPTNICNELEFCPAIKTHFDATSQAQGQQIIANPGSPYRALCQKNDEVAASMRGQELGPEVFHALSSRL
jgi:hypothetical protein